VAIYGQKEPEMENEKEEVSLSNLCGGAIEEVFQREFAKDDIPIIS
jgi:hypothetical protein